MLFDDGTASAYTRKSKTDFEARLGAIASEIERHNPPDCIGVCIEKPFGRFSGIDVMLGMFGVAVHTCERLGIPWAYVNLMTSKKHATGRGNADKAAMMAAARERWGQDFGPDEADALWAAAYAMDCKLFG